jgi:hypothetical protein
VTLRARWVTLRARWVPLRARWVTLRDRWVSLRAQFQGVRQVTGVDYSFARHRLSQQLGNRSLLPEYRSKVRWVYADVHLFAQQLVERSATVDLVTMFEVLEHLQVCVRESKPGGHGRWRRPRLQTAHVTI